METFETVRLVIRADFWPEENQTPAVFHFNYAIESGVVIIISLIVIFDMFMLHSKFLEKNNLELDKKVWKG